MGAERLAFFPCRYRGGVDADGRQVMVVVGAHFLLRCLDLERFVLYVVKVSCLIRSFDTFEHGMLNKHVLTAGGKD